jgi:LacI family transcriptional regulator
MNSSRQARIARRAKVSQSTVSRALRNHPALSRETCLRIQALARRLGYAPNPLVSSIFANLRRRKGCPHLGTLAFLTAHASRDAWRGPGTYRDFFLGAQERSAQQGFALEPHWAAEPGMTGARLNAILRARGILGVILGTRDAEQRFIDLAWEQFALVRVGRSQRIPALHCAVNHQYHTVRRVAEQLAARGYARIGLVLSRWQNDVTNQSWLAGFLVWQQSQPSRQRVPAHLVAELAEGPFWHWFKRVRPDAVISVNPDVVRWLRAGPLVLPGQVGAALLDWHEHYGDIAGADQNNHLVGAAAVDILLGQLRRNERGLPAHPRTTLIESSWQDGATVRPRLDLAAPVPDPA